MGRRGRTGGGGGDGTGVGTLLSGERKSTQVYLKRRGLSGAPSERTASSPNSEIGGRRWRGDNLHLSPFLIIKVGSAAASVALAVRFSP